MKDPYQVLGIQPSATDEEVKAAYRELAKKYHPDNYANNPLSDLAQQKMQEINEAYDAIIKARKEGAGGAYSGAGAPAGAGYARSGGNSRFMDIRNLIRTAGWWTPRRCWMGFRETAGTGNGIFSRAVCCTARAGWRTPTTISARRCAWTRATWSTGRL